MTTRLLRLTTFAFLLAAASMAQATTFTVTTTSDNGDNTTPTAGSLRAAIKAANADNTATALAPHIITFSGSGASGTINLITIALPVINNHITISGPGASTLTVARSGAAPNFSVFTMGGGFTINIFGLSITSGSALGGGGGILNAGSTVTVNYCTISGNSAPSGGGGGILNTAFGSITLNNSTISGNICGTNNGAGLHNVGTMMVNNSTISSNTAGSNGAGGLYSIGGTATLTNSTVHNNTAGLVGGGGINRVLGTVVLRNTIVAGNNGPSTSPDIKSTAGIISQGNNLIGNGTGSTGLVHNVNDDQVGSTATPINPLLNSLAFNGGPTPTHSLQSTSPALDEGSDAVLLPPYNFTTDQRGSGFARKAGSSVDIGAFEFGADESLPVELSGFILASTNSSVTLQWRTASEVRNAGFEVQRSSESDSSFTTIASYLDHPALVGLGTSSYGKAYSLVDGDRAPGLYRYRLVDVSTEGIRTSHAASTIRVEDEATIDISFLRLHAVTPNPANNEVQIGYTLPEAMNVSLDVYASDGRRVAVVLDGETRVAGSHSQNVPVAELTPGIYTLRLTAGNSSRVRRFVIVR